MFKTILILLFFINIAYSITPDQIWRINPDHSEIFFKVSYLTISDVTGRLSAFQGRVYFEDDLQLPKNISINVRSDSVNTGNNMRDGHLRSVDFLNAKIHPKIIFRSQTISAKGPGKFLLQGELSLRGITKKHAIEFELSKTVKDTWGHLSKFAKFKFRVNRKDFQINWGKTLSNNKFLVGDYVDIWGTFQIQPLRYLTPSWKHTIPDTKYIRLKEQLNRGDITQEEFNSVLEGNIKKKGSKNKAPFVMGKTNLKEKIVVSKKSGIYNRNRDSNKKSFEWWLSYFLMGLLGLAATVIVGLKIKFSILNKWPKKYEETGIIGILSDLILLPIVFAYFYSMWVLGYGG